MNTVLSFIQSFNWVDIIILITCALYIVEGYSVGVISGLFDVISFLASFLAGLKFSKPLGNFVESYFNAPQSISRIIGFVIGAIAAELLLRFLQRHFLKTIKESSLGKNKIARQLSSILGIIPGLLSGIVLVAFFLTILTVFPFAPPIKQAIGESRMGTFLVSRTQSLEGDLTNIFGGKPNDLITFFTVEPEAQSIVPLHFTKADGAVDTVSEQQMFFMVNSEREKAGLQDLALDTQLRDIARAHSQDMLARGYFSHYTPDGKSPFDRMTAAGISFTAAGENLAFSANVNLAMQGLMQSPGHRANILSPNFGKIGIGVIDAGIYGKMFSQEFTN